MDSVVTWMIKEFARLQTQTSFVKKKNKKKISEIKAGRSTY